MEFPINFGVIGLKSPSFSIAHEPPRFHYLVLQTQFPFFRCCGRSKGKRDEGRKKRRGRGGKGGVGRRGKSRPLGMRNCETRIRETSVKRLRFQALTRDFARTRDAPRLTSWGSDTRRNNVLIVRKENRPTRIQHIMHVRTLGSYLYMRYTRVNKGSLSRETNVFVFVFIERLPATIVRKRIYMHNSNSYAWETRRWEKYSMCEKKIYKRDAFSFFEISFAWQLCSWNAYAYFFTTRLEREKIITLPRT